MSFRCHGKAVVDLAVPACEVPVTCVTKAQIIDMSGQVSDGSNGRKGTQVVFVTERQLAVVIQFGDGR